MTYVYRLAGDNLELAKADLEGFMRSQGTNEEVERTGRIAFTDAEPGQLRRLALTHEVGELVYQGSFEGFDAEKPEKSFAVDAHDISGDSDTEEVEEEIGEALSGSQNTVDLESPSETFHTYMLEGEIVVSREVEDIPRGKFAERSNENRPFSSPVSLDPVLARVMVNLSEVPPGGHVLDPFCGTGGILLEAGLCGIGVHGLDIQEEMVGGTKKNLGWVGILVNDIREGKISEAPEKFDDKFDAVITDLPYGKASKEEGNPVETFLEVAPEMTDGKIVFMYDRSEIGDLEPEHEIYVHKNLTRYLYVLETPCDQAFETSSAP